MAMLTKINWLERRFEWHAEAKDLIAQAEALVALMKLAKSQIKRDPPE